MTLTRNPGGKLVEKESSTMLSKYLRTLLDWVFPPICAACGKEGEIFCAECLGAIIPIKQPTCRYCSLSLAKPGICTRCLEGDHPYTEVVSYAVYSGSLRSAIHAMKYQNNFWLGELLSRHMIALLKDKNWPIDVVMPIPLSEERLEERGYNQAALLSKPIAKYFGWKHDQRSLVRIKGNHSQVALTREQRFENVRSAFLSEIPTQSNLRVLLVDDVFTTGATITEASKTLRATGFTDIYAITLAKASIRN